MSVPLHLAHNDLVSVFLTILLVYRGSLKTSTLPYRCFRDANFSKHMMTVPLVAI